MPAKVLEHRSDVVRRSEEVVNFLEEVGLESHGFGGGDGDAFIDYETLERRQRRVRDTAYFAAEDRSDRVHDAIDDKLVPHIRADVWGDAAIQSGAAKD